MTDPHLLVIFGGTGDLARRKLLPAYHLLVSRGTLRDSLVLAVARKPLGDDDYRTMTAAALSAAGIPNPVEWCRRCLFYQPISDGMASLRSRIEALEEEHRLPGNRAFYLAMPPQEVISTVAALGEAGLARAPGWVRIVVEKPFGYDLESARNLNREIGRYFEEEQVYRIDHYLAKDTVQNLMVFRFANPLFESSWNRDRVARVDISVAETIGVGNRAGYFDRAGIIRDVVQNHALQLLTLVGMEPPVKFSAGEIRDEKVKVLRSIYPVDPVTVLRGQYQPGVVEGEPVAGYQEEPGVMAGSLTETFARLGFQIDTWRWRGVPFQVTAGKRLAERLTRITVTFRDPPVALFEGDGGSHVSGDELRITLQPNEGFDLLIDVKSPGQGFAIRRQSLRFRYAEAFGPLPDAYEAVLTDLIEGDQTLFVRADEVEEAWRILMPVLDLPAAPLPYAAGSWGPRAG
jgi:glucose-6-phosphate 1-dehydrogenase